MLLGAGVFSGIGGGGSGLAATEILAGNRNKPNTNTSTTTALMRHHFQYRKIINGITNPRVKFENAYLQSNGGLTSTSLTDFHLTASIEYPVGSGTLYHLLNAGTHKNRLDAGDEITLTAAGLALPDNSACRIVYDLEFIGGGTATFPTGFYTSGSKDYVNSGASNTSLLADGTQSMPSPSTFTTFMYGPSAFYGLGSSNRVYLFCGDSILNASGEGDQADYDANDSAFPVLNIGNRGLGEKGVGDLYPSFNMSSDGRAASTVSAANHGWLFDIAKGTKYAIVLLGTNDISGGASAATTETRIEAVITLIKAQLPGTKVYICTIPPRTTGTWTSKAGQTIDGNAAVRSTLNASIRTGLSGADGHIEVARRLEDPTDEDYWLSEDSTAHTDDGIHPNRLGHHAAAEVIRDFVLGKTNLIKNPWFVEGLTHWDDKSQGTGATSWDTSGKLSMDGVDNSNRAYRQQSFTTVASTEYTVTADFDGLGSAGYIRVGTSADVLTGPNYDLLNQSVPSDGTATGTFTATGTTTYLTFHSLANSSSFTIDNVRVEES